MSWRTDYRDLFLRYLAGELSDEETSRVEQRLLFDDDFFDRMEEAQNDLLDAYAAGELNDVQRCRLEAVLRSKPAHKRRLRVARALQEIRQPTPLKGQAAGTLQGRGLLWPAPLAVACAAIAVAAILYVKGHSRLKIALVTSQRKTISSPPGPSSQPAPPSQETLRTPHNPAFALLVGGSVERGSASDRTVALPHGVDTLEVQILLPPQGSGNRYDVQVILPHAAAVKSFAGLVPENAFSERLVRFDLPVRGLPSGLYIFRVYREGTARRTPAASYQAVITRG